MAHQLFVLNPVPRGNDKGGSEVLLDSGPINVN